MTERRQAKRIKRRLTVRWGEKDLSRAGFTHDVSSTGMFVIADGHIPRSGRLHVQVFLTKEEFVLFEAMAVREKQVPPELRQIARGGFGVRFLSSFEALGPVLPQMAVAPNHFVVEYPTLEDLQRAHASELRHGGVFVATERSFPRDSEATVELRLSFVGRSIDLDARVLHVSDGAHGSVRGLGLAFDDRDRALAEIAAVLDAPAPA